MRAAIIGLLVAVVALLGVIVYLLLPEGVDEEREAAREEFEGVAGYYCTLSGVVVPPLQGLEDPRFNECVDNRVENQLEQWENEGRPDPSTIG